MKTKLLALLSGATVLGCVSGARAGAPAMLSNAQLDQVTAGITKMVEKASPNLITAGLPVCPFSSGSPILSSSISNPLGKDVQSIERGTLRD